MENIIRTPPVKNTIIYHCNTLILLLMTLEQALQEDIEDSQRWLNLEKDESKNNLRYLALSLCLLLLVSLTNEVPVPYKLILFF